MSLPKQIQKQVTAAQNIIDEFEKNVQTAEEKVAAEAQSTQTTDNVQADSGKDSAAQVPQQASTQSADEDENSPTYKQRWKTMDGQLRAAAMREQQWQTRVQQLEQLIANMQAAPAATNTPSPAAAKVTAEDREAFGEDLVNLIDRSTKATLAEENASLRNTVADLSNAVREMQSTIPQVVQNQQVSADERFFTQVGSEIPDWKTINNNPVFIDWLLDVDPMTGITRQTYLAEAQRERNVMLVANIFNTWKAINGNTQTQQQGKAAAKATKTELEKQVAPSRNLATTANVSSGDKQIWTSSLVRKFYSDVRNGLYRTRDAERVSLERDIFAAQNEGRFDAAA